MKKGLKILMLTLACMVGLSASAQFRMGAVLGGNATNLHFKQDLAPVSQVFGGQAGAIGELMFPGIGFGIDFGMLYNLNGANVDFGDKLIWQSQGYGKERLLLHQLSIPFHLRFKWTRMQGLEEIIAPFVYGGPDFNILLGHNKCEAVEFAGGDLSLSVGLGAEILKRWQVSASYSWGMTYALKTRLLTNYSAQTRQWTLRFTYFW